MRKNKKKTIALTLAALCISSVTAFAATDDRTDGNGNRIYGSLYGDTKQGQARTEYAGSNDASYVYIEGISSNGYVINGLVGQATGGVTAYKSITVGTNGTPYTWHSAHGCNHLSGTSKFALWITA